MLMISNLQTIICDKLNVLEKNIKIYPLSYCKIADIELQMVAINNIKNIAIYGKGLSFDAFEGNTVAEGFKLCPLIHTNRLALNKLLDYTCPQAFGKNISTFGAGDRLGLASPGHIRSISRSLAKPILAQQSKRELELTGRTYEDVLDSVSFAVFQEGYKDGFGADGDHLKEEAHIIDALNCGYTMITLDCSEKIGKGVEKLSSAEMENRYISIPADIRKRLEDKYLARTFNINGVQIKYTKLELIKNVLIYYEAICFIIFIYKKYLSPLKREKDFEISIDETESTTSEYGHLFVASEIIDAGVDVTSMAPKFIGEFQKGIDYIGNVADFEAQLGIHAAIADYFGYKLSIHSGSDKFSVFELIGDYTKGRLHLKTSGTNWLEAVGTIAERNPTLYRQIHKCAQKHFTEAKSFYDVSADISKVPDVDSVSDAFLKEYLTDTHSRQLLHITYGYILRDPEIRTSIYDTLNENEDLYIHRLETHIGRHLELVGLYNY